MDAWNLTALTYMHVNEWKIFLRKQVIQVTITGLSLNLRIESHKVTR